MNSEKQYKHIENKIIEAANSNNYTFTEDAWNRMELLLNKKDKKRRFLFWILPLFLLGFIGGGIGLYNNSKSTANSEKLVASNSNTPKVNDEIDSQNLKAPNTTSNLTSIDINKSVALKNNPSSKNKNASIDINNTNIISTGNLPKEKNNNIQAANKKIRINKTATSSYQKKIKNIAVNLNNNEEDDYVDANNDNYKTKAKANVKISSPSLQTNEDEPNQEKTVGIDVVTALENVPLSKKEIITEVEKQNNETAKASPQKTDSNSKKEVVTKSKKDNKKAKKQNGFFITSSLGVEVNTIKPISFKNTKAVLRYGIGVGYQFNNKLSVQTGFYVSGKKYIAQKKDYKFAPNSYWSYANIIKIAANCKVYEIPISVQYKILNKSSFNIFGSVGLSSYIMKKEDYVYEYWRSGTLYSAPYTFTKNTHLLAAANFSIGVEKIISNKISLQISPRVSMPLDGVGNGSVKLYSSGIDFGVKYFPFNNKK